MKISTLCFIAGMLIYIIISKYIFDVIYLTARVVVDEEFHLPLGLAYCRYDFSVWDTKVTTLPGLYLLSTAILGPFGLCKTYWLRFISFGASIINIPLFYLVFSKYEKNRWRNILSAFGLALLPPLYFFSHFYYTDVVSLTVILIMVICSETGHHYFASLFGFLAILCRQNNVIWVGMLFGRYLLVELYVASEQNEYPAPASPRGLPTRNITKFQRTLLANPLRILKNTSLQFWLDSVCYGGVLLTFLYFVYINGSIVVGDKTAHQIVLHFPQLYYFSLFCLIFSWPHFLGEVTNFLKFTRRHKCVIATWILIGFMVVYENTLVHPYMLADNRHYIFYIWNRFYSRYPLFRYAMVPVYVFAWYVIIKVIFNRNDASYFLAYMPCVFVLLATQKLIDVRYYFVPYAMFRFRLKNTPSSIFNLTLELVTYVVINAITFNLFFHKTITWADYDFQQRLIW